MAKSSKLSQEMIDNIKSYSEEITTLEDFVAGVRQNVGMYIGSKGNKGFINMIREILQNAIDEMMKKSSPCDFVKISFDERTNWVIVEDNGRGIPFDDMIRIFQNEHTSSNYKKKKGEYSSGLHGVGAKVTNALSKTFVVESYILGQARRLEFNDGHPSKKGVTKIPNKDNKQGSIIQFQPSYEVLGDLSVTWKEVYNLVALILPLANIGARVQFNAIDLKGESYSELLVNEDGILTYLINNVESPLVKPIQIYVDTGERRMDLVFTFDSADMSLDASIVAFANCCPTSAGTHIEGFKKGISTFFANYMNKIYLATADKGKGKKKPITITPNDVRTGLKAILSVYHLEPIFNGQAKEIFANEDMAPFVRDEIIKGLDEWAKQNPSDLQKLCKYFKEVAQLRMNADKEKVKLNNKYSKSMSGLPAKFVAPSSKEHMELWICEGDSAAGTMRNHRAPNQGYFPIRGKIPNALKNAPAKFLANAEISGIINILGAGYGKSFDISQVKWEKIIFGVDADADGDHIASLGLIFFMVYMPGLIESGKVYKSVPPLYGIPMGGKKMKFLKDKMEFVEYVQAAFSNKYTVTRVDGSKITKSELSKILYNNSDYTYEVEKIANGYSTDPFLLESVLLLKDLPVKEMKARLKKLFRFIDVKQSKDSIVVSGSHDSKYQTVILNQKLLNHCNNIFPYFKSNKDLVYKVNGEDMSLYEMMHLFDKSTPNMSRFKGLGEMTGDRLYESTLNPDNRLLVRYTIEDVKKDMEKIRYYHDNKNMLLNDVKVTRFDLLS